jgi:hypothetical protein
VTSQRAPPSPQLTRRTTEHPRATSAPVPPSSSPSFGYGGSANGRGASPFNGRRGVSSVGPPAGPFLSGRPGSESGGGGASAAAAPAAPASAPAPPSTLDQPQRAGASFGGHQLPGMASSSGGRGGNAAMFGPGASDDELIKPHKIAMQPDRPDLAKSVIAFCALIFSSLLYFKFFFFIHSSLFFSFLFQF